MAAHAGTRHPSSIEWSGKSALNLGHPPNQLAYPKADIPIADREQAVWSDKALEGWGSAVCRSLRRLKRIAAVRQYTFIQRIKYFCRNPAVDPLGEPRNLRNWMVHSAKSQSGLHSSLGELGGKTV